jgi:CRP-like cAMP-binding protein
VALRTALPARGGALVTAWRPLLDAYGRGWALPDLVSVFPWDALVAGAAAARAVAPSPLALKLAKLPRLLRARLALRALRASGDATRAAGGSAGPAQRLAQLVGGFLLLAHCGACAMWTASRWQVEHTAKCGIHAFTGLRPMALRDYRRGVNYTPEADAAQAALCALRSPAGLALPPDATWSLYCADLPTKYMAMAYYALTTLVTTGFGDIVPGTNVERACAMALQLAGCVSCAVVFGNVALLLEGWDRAGARLRHRLSALAALAAHHSLPPRLARAAAEHAAATWRATCGVDMAAVRAALPPCVAADVAVHLHGPALDACPLFAHACPALRRALAGALRAEVYADGDVIIQRRDAGGAMYFLTAGAALVTRARVTCATLRPGDCFGELQLRGGTARRAACITAHGRAGASVLCLSRADLDAALSDFPEAVPPLRAALAARHAAARAARQEAVAAAAADAEAAAAAKAVAAADATSEEGCTAKPQQHDSEDDDDDDDECGDDPACFGLLPAEDDAPGAGLARQLWHVRVVAGAQQRVLRARLACAAQTFAELDAQLDAALAACGVTV